MRLSLLKTDSDGITGPTPCKKLWLAPDCMCGMDCIFGDFLRLKLFSWAFRM
jgi:hypothetical protein